MGQNVISLPLADTKKLAIQQWLMGFFPRGTIGPQRARADRFEFLSEALLEKHFELRHLDATPVPKAEDGLTNRSIVAEIVRSAEIFYGKREDELSVTDYVTDFPEIVRRCNLVVFVR